MEKFYKDIELIQSINRSSIKEETIISISYLFAKEFSSTVRNCIEKYKEDENFQKFIKGEINTNNLRFKNYENTGDHYEFLEHFMLGKNDINEKIGLLKKTKEYNEYIDFINSLNIDEKLATLVSREKHLHGIFLYIVESKKWSEENDFFNYFLKKHIELDSNEEDGHEEVTKNLLDTKTHTSVLNTFREKRLSLYEKIVEIG